MKSKKIILVTLILVSLTTFSFSGCTKPADNTTDKPSENSTENTSTLPNPMAEKASTAEIQEALGFTFDSLPANISDVKYFTIADNLAQANFTLNGVSYTVRKADATVDDIAGVYTEFTNSQTIPSPSGAAVLYQNNDDGMGLATWASGAFVYSVFCDKGFDLTAVEEIVNAVS